MECLMPDSKTLKKLIRSRHMNWGVALASALETTIVPVPFEFLLIPALQANRRRMFRLTFMALLGCIFGALIGYAAGYGMYETLGRWIISVTGAAEQFENARQALKQNAFGFIVSVGITPVPFQIAMVAAGAVKYGLFGFITATTLSRFLRYFGVAGLVWFFGDDAEKLYRKHQTAVGWGAVIAVIAYWMAFGVL
jgi:membrane protein YqaA with SNARE-associated domain